MASLVLKVPEEGMKSMDAAEGKLATWKRGIALLTAAQVWGLMGPSLDRQ